MLCPFCQTEMKLGCIQCRDGLYWSPKKRIAPALPPLDKNAVDLSPAERAFNGITMKAYLCSECKKVIIDYGHPY